MRKGERYRKGVRGCIISRHISVLHLVIVKKGPAEIPGLTDESIPCARLCRSSHHRTLARSRGAWLWPCLAQPLPHTPCPGVSEASVGTGRPPWTGTPSLSAPLPPPVSARSAFLLACSLPTRRRLGPKRASKIRKLFALSKDDDVRKYVIRRELPSKTEGKKGSSKAPKIQRLVTPQLLQRKRDTLRFKKIRQAKAKVEAADYQKLLSQRQKEVRDKKMEKISQRKSARSSRASEE